ncbi:MAG TPA: trypsin-like serine protease [Myxococcaceae bacterium]|jgi:hypothetical protein
MWLLAVGPGCGPVLESSSAPATVAQQVVGGTDAPEDEAVVALVARRTRCTGEPLTLLCSGALIAPDVVLTAAHCLNVFGVEGPYEVFFGAELLPEPRGRFVQVSRAVRHPDSVPQTHAYDAALLRLATPVAVTPLRLPGPSGLALAPGAASRVLGFGETKDAQAPSGRRRQGGLTVTEVTPSAFLAGPAPAMSCVGDSGGPVLVSDGTGEVLAGITASGDVACRKEAFNVRVEALRDTFLQPFLDEQAMAPAPTLAPENLCRDTCAQDTDCPSGLTCVSLDGAPGRCLLPALQEGDYGALCTEDAACGTGGLCARLESEGAEACRCFTPCAAPAPSDAGGCTSAPGPALLGLLAVAGWLRRPRRRLSAGRSSGWAG